jgi:predicted Rossmann fold flavoprotein
VIGGGPAGMMAAIRASEFPAAVTLIERNPSLGKKLLLSGKGRCNLTNACELEFFLKRFSRNGQFLRDAFKKFFTGELRSFFEQRGVALKVERQLRIFPVSDRSGSIVDALEGQLRKNKVRLLLQKRVKEVCIHAGVVRGVTVYDEQNDFPAERVIIATGGLSYTGTGSSGDGFTLARQSGHHIVPLRAGLVPLQTKQRFPASLKGLTLKNIRLRFTDGKKDILSDTGELLFTHFGISGPLVLSLSGMITDWLKEAKVWVEIDLKPALTEKQLEGRLLREFAASPKKNIRTILRNLLPLRLVDVFLQVHNVAPDKQVSHMTQVERKSIVYGLKGMRLDISGPRPLEEAMVTRGGVDLKEINPRTMESRLVKGLYFAGEVIDVDADTGGFNLQAAFSTGYLAGESAGGGSHERG